MKSLYEEMSLISTINHSHSIPRFTKVESGADAFAASKAMGFCTGDGNSFVLSTGGDDVPLEERVSNNSTLRCHNH